MTDWGHWVEIGFFMLMGGLAVALVYEFKRWK
jgi:hypothetical protein